MLVAKAAAPPPNLLFAHKNSRVPSVAGYVRVVCMDKVSCRKLWSTLQIVYLIGAARDDFLGIDLDTVIRNLQRFAVSQVAS